MSLIRQEAIDLALKMRVLTLATSFEQESWTAPVYYFFSNTNFYFFSNPDSRHIKDAFTSEISSNQIAASVFTDDTNFKNIKGLQMQGKIARVNNKKDAFLRAKEYIKKFKIQYNREDILEFFHNKYKSKFYKFIPETVFFMDNSQKIGTRTKIEL